MRVLIRLPTWVGDAVMATPTLRAVRAGFPAAEVVVAGKKPMIGMLDGGGFFDRALTLPAEGGRLGPVRFGRALAREQFDLALLLPNSWSSAIEAFVARIPERIGYAKDGRGILLTRALRAIRVGRLRPIPMAEYYLEIAKAAGCPVERTGLKLELPAPPAALERAQAYLARHGIGPDERPVALSVGASFGLSKLWTVPGWAAVADHFVRAGRRVLIYGGPNDRPVVDRVIAAMREEGAIPATDVPLSDLAAHMRRAAILVSTDSGGRHFGVAAGIPVVVIMGSTHPAYSEGQESDPYVVLLEKVECWPCHLKVCPIDHRCMSRIPPERVVAAAEALLSGRHPFDGARPWVTRAGEESAHFTPRLYSGAAS